MKVRFSDKCTKLPDIFNLETKTSLPADHGTSVEVNCISGYSLTGSRLITCVKDDNWHYEETPGCILGWFNLFSRTSMFQVFIDN